MKPKTKSISIEEYKELNQPKSKKGGIGQEDFLHIQFGCLIQKYEKMGLLDCIFWSYIASGEYRKPTTAAMLKKKGLKAGQADYLFIYRDNNFKDHIIWLEFKTATGKQQTNQKDFEIKFKNALNSNYYLVRSINEALKVLEKERILLISKVV